MNDLDEDDVKPGIGRESAREAPTAFNTADPPRNFTILAEDRIRALTIGAPAYATRKKSIEDLEERHVRALVTVHDALVARGVRDEQAIVRAMLDKAATFDLDKLNGRIATHNRYYPIEANLATDLRTGEYLVYGRPWRPTEPWTVERFFARARAVIAARE